MYQIHFYRDSDGSEPVKEYIQKSLSSLIRTAA